MEDKVKLRSEDKEAVTRILNQISGISWRDSDEILRSEVSSFSDSLFDSTVLKTDFLEEAMRFKNLAYWQADRFTHLLLLKFKGKADEILKSNGSDLFKFRILKLGYYSDVKMIDYVAINSKGSSQELASELCSVEALRKIKDSGNSKIRKIAFERLGPVECLDDMLKDKKADIREAGVRMAPVGYSKLNDMTKEIARGPFSGLVQKISSEYLPMLLANRNLKYSWVSKALQSRIEIEGDNDD